MKRAWVFSGGANRGAMQVGAMAAMFYRGMPFPDLVTGTSAGALNGMAFSAMPNELGLGHLANLWRMTKREDVWPGNPLTWAWRQIAGWIGLTPKPLGLVSYEHLLAYVERSMDFIFGRHDLRFGDLSIPLLVTAVNEVWREPVTLGLNKEEPLAISVTASAAMPGVSDPVPYAGTLLTDGGVTNPLPIDLAITAGADEIWAIDLSGFNYPYTPSNILEQAAALFDIQQDALTQKGVDEAARHNITLHRIRMGFNVDIMDFSKADEMIKEGRRITLEYLDDPTPVRVREAV